jgi:regulator of protease activity HflC (stomatin/prohibitin superfamily)
LTAGKVRLIAILILVGIAVIIGLSGIYVVNPGEQAVVLTFGRNTTQRIRGFTSGYRWCSRCTS